MTKIFNPVASYRIQFHKDFTFRDADRLIPYWKALGINTLYASPIFEAVPGSMHGYDVTNPLHVNPEIGTLDELRKLTAKCKQHNLSWIQDIVPNHMAFHPANEWLMDLLEKGKASSFASVFDTGFGNNFFQGPVMVPFLGDGLKETIARKEIKLVLKGGKLHLNYFDQLYPVNIKGYRNLLDQIAPEAKGALNAMNTALGKAEQLLADKEGHFERAWADFFLEWLRYIEQDDTAIEVSGLMKQINLDQEALFRLCEQQYYRLCSWKETDKEINYRRFFTVNSLICLQVQREEVFELTHQFVKQMIDEGCFQGLRIDHIDGLFDPEKYLNDLRGLVGSEVYIVVEKILEQDEKLPVRWPVQGTSGYDYLALSNKLFTLADTEPDFTRVYRQLIGPGNSIDAQISEKKRFILEQHMQGEVENLVRLLKKSQLLPKAVLEDIGETDLQEAIAVILIFCPVYRFYGNRVPLPTVESRELKALFDDLRKKKTAHRRVFDILENLLVVTPSEQSKQFNERLLYFYQRLMQFSGPLMAKGVEDTLMYTYNRFIGHNEVGDTPTNFGLSKKKFHELIAQRQRYWPLAMNATATHDTKRGEDARARLQILSCLPKTWKRTVTELEKIVKNGGKFDFPDINDRYFIYQTLLSTYPGKESEEKNYHSRLAAYLEKALREAKVNSAWANPNEAYEKKCIDFAFSLLEETGNFRSLWEPLFDEVQKQGMFSSLAQVLLKTTVPGVPDFYQGTELWDLSFVDPDNRRSVDYKMRNDTLQSIEGKKIDLLDYWHKRKDGRIKLILIKQLLRYRSQSVDLFEKGIYIPIKVRGRYRKHLIVFCRRYQQQWSLIFVPLHLAALCANQNCEVENIDWKNTRIDWPHDIPTDYYDVINEKEGSAREFLHISDLFEGSLPLAVLAVNGKKKTRAAGILMSVASLPSDYGIGDLGPQAHSFATKLDAARQAYWQLLPLNPTGKSEHYSPYSAYSVFAGNPLLISPEVLAKSGLLTNKELGTAMRTARSQINYEEVAQTKEQLFRLAFTRFVANTANSHYKEFERFMQSEKSWLDDFALYLLIKKEQQGKPWYKWPSKLKLRDKPTLLAMAKKYKTKLLEIKWQQYELFRQWQALKTHCETLGIRLLGDLPIYVNYDSADVWLNRQLFNLNEQGDLAGIAGVPPDYFNGEGQLWGMPTFSWEAHRKENYKWWVARVKKNLEWYHLVRLDHFRAFYDYWEVPAGEKNAINGVWKPGPRDELFDVLKRHIGDLPLVAEDLGDITQGVYELRDRLGLPGMRVLQFAFDEDMAQSLHIPHQYVAHGVAYTGTHDNNTITGWYKEELDKHGKERLARYLGYRVKEATVHRHMIRLVYASVANLVIIPLQDLLGLGAEARMNTPATTGINWKWQLLSDQFAHEQITWLRNMVNLYGR